MTVSRSIPLGALCVLALLQSVGAQNRPAAKPLPPGDWPMYRRDTSGTGHSPLAQINAANVSRLTRAWTYRLQTEGAQNVNSQATPIVVGGVMYMPAGDRVVALDPATGTEKWRHMVTGGAPSRRGVGYWPGEGATAPRIIFTAGRRLIAHRRRHGRARRRRSARTARWTWASPTTRCRSSTTTSSSSARTRRPALRRHRQRARVRRANRREALGVQLGAAAGTRRARYVGRRQLEGPPRRERVAVLLHGRRSARPALHSARVAHSRHLRRRPRAARTCSATRSSPSTSRPARTSGTSRRSITISGMPIRPRRRASSTSSGTAAPMPALALTTKSGYLYLLNRETGEPMFGVEERPVAASDVPGERAFPTQPIPVKPPPIARVNYGPRTW